MQEDRHMARFKLIFPSERELDAATAFETAGVQGLVINRKRSSVAVEVEAPTAMPETFSAETAQRSTPLCELAERFGAQIVEDYQYELEPTPEFLQETSVDSAEGSLEEVIGLIKADKAHEHATGEDVTIAIVDTGVDGSHPEFAQQRRVGGWAPHGEDPWTDWQGHGTMCMTIAGANGGKGSRYLGVAPAANLMSCRTSFFDSELTAIYDLLIDRANAGERIVASNSFGRRTGSPPPPPGPGSQFADALDEAISSGILVVFSAGNNHELAGGNPQDCTPNSVWMYKSRADLLAVATCDLDEKMWFYSSRGPGQHHGQPGTNEKPDVTAPTPRNGRILYGSEERVLQNGWGTSGACPQVAGLAALIWSRHSRMASQQIIDVIKSSARDLGHGASCQGSGMIDCKKALAHLAVG
jgi:serine protease AprX